MFSCNFAEVATVFVAVMVGWLSMDWLGRMSLFVEHEPHNLLLNEDKVYNRTWPEDGISAEGPPPESGFRWYDNVKPHAQALLFPGDGGIRWRVATTDAELSAGIQWSRSPPPHVTARFTPALQSRHAPRVGPTRGLH